MNKLQAKRADLLERVTTSALDEQAVVSHMMQRPGDIDLITTIIRGDDFHDIALRRLFELLVSMFATGELSPAGNNDGIIASRLSSSGLMDELGGPRAFAKLLEIPPNHPRYHAREVQNRSNARKMLTCLEMAEDAILSGVDCQDAVADLLAQSEAIQARQADDTKSVHQLMQEELQRLQTWRPPDVMSGLPKVDSVFGGFVGGEVVTVCAQTSGGKSAFALQAAQHNGMKGRPVLFISLEMRESEKIKRLWRGGAGLAGVRFGRAELTEKQRRAVEVETARNANNRLHICYMPTPTWRDIETKVRRFRAQHGLSLVILDYIGLVHKSDPRQTVQEKTGEITSGMKRLAGQLDCVAMQLVQLNREGMKNKHVELHNMADSSSVERDSDIVLAIQQPNEVDNGEREILVLKNRNGERVRMTNFMFDGSRMMFEESVAYTPWDGGRVSDR